jgi:hypothetical protein
LIFPLRDTIGTIVGVALIQRTLLNEEKAQISRENQKADATFLNVYTNNKSGMEMARIFIAHSSKDDWLINPIAATLRLIGVEPYLAKLEDPTPYPLPQKLDLAIESSSAMFAFLTPNVENNKDTWDIVNWEISSAYAKKKPVYVFVEKGVNVPIMVNYTVVYATYDPFDQQSLNKMIARVKEIGSALKRSEDIAKAAFTIVALILGLGLFFTALAGD